MAEITVMLEKGLTIAKETHLEAVLREVTAGDMIEATEESEKLVSTPSGYQLLASPTLVGMNTLRRQIVRIGLHKGPLTLGELKKLSSTDIGLLQDQAVLLENASLEGVTSRGRDNETPA